MNFARARITRDNVFFYFEALGTTAGKCHHCVEVNTDFLELSFVGIQRAFELWIRSWFLGLPDIFHDNCSLFGDPLYKQNNQDIYKIC